MRKILLLSLVLMSNCAFADDNSKHELKCIDGTIYLFTFNKVKENQYNDRWHIATVTKHKVYRKCPNE